MTEPQIVWALTTQATGRWHIVRNFDHMTAMCKSTVPLWKHTIRATEPTGVKICQRCKDIARTTRGYK